MEKNDYILFALARSKGYSDELCFLLHAKEVEFFNYHIHAAVDGAPFIYVLQEAIKDKISEADILKMALGNMDYVFLADDLGEEALGRNLDREFAIEDGEKPYLRNLTPSGEFDYKKAIKKIIKIHPDFIDKMKESGYPITGIMNATKKKWG